MYVFSISLARLASKPGKLATKMKKNKSSSSEVRTLLPASAKQCMSVALTFDSSSSTEKIKIRFNGASMYLSHRIYIHI